MLFCFGWDMVFFLLFFVSGVKVVKKVIKGW